MPRLLLILAMLMCSSDPPLKSQEQKPAGSGHYLFAWTGDVANKGNDFLAVINADPSSASYGHLVTTIVTDQQTKLIHHTEYTMPASGMLFANDHNAGRTFVFDLRDPVHPKIAASFTDMGGFMHPHSFLRLPNGHVLATFQHSHNGPSEGQMGVSGGLVEIDDQGKLIRASSSADAAFPRAVLTPYNLVVLPELDRVVSTNTSMDYLYNSRGLTYQVWRLSDLKLLKTDYFDPGENRYGQIDPQEARLGPDGSVFVATATCGIERITQLNTDTPTSTLVYTFPGPLCGVLTIVGHFLIQPVPYTHGLIVLDIANGAKPVEVSRLKISDAFYPHWTSYDPKTQRLAITGGGKEEGRLYVLRLNPKTGALSMDDAFHDAEGRPGFDFADREWPHGWKGSGSPHGAVFSR
jgi:hypothetical protein